MPEQIITMTQDELDELIEKRIARVRREYEEDGQDSYKAHSRKWEDRAKKSSKALEEARTALGAMSEDRDAWKNRARYYLAQAQLLGKLNDKLVSRIERFTR